MEYNIKNWVLKENINDIKILDITITQKLNDLLIPVKDIETVIDWDKINPKYNFFYDYEGNEIDIPIKLKKSSINNYSKILVDIGCGNPLVEVNTSIFIEKWENFVASNGYSGIVVFTNDGKFFIEFTDDSDYQLYSNFLI